MYLDARCGDGSWSLGSRGLEFDRRYRQHVSSPDSNAATASRWCTCSVATVEAGDSSGDLGVLFYAYLSATDGSRPNCANSEATTTNDVKRPPATSKSVASTATSAKSGYAKCEIASTGSTTTAVDAAAANASSANATNTASTTTAAATATNDKANDCDSYDG